MRLNRFINHIMDESINDKFIFKAVFMGGIPGSGKSFMAELLTQNILPRIVNTDKIEEFRDKWHTKHELKYSLDWNRDGKRIELLNKNQLALYFNSVLPLLLDGTSKNIHSVVKRIKILKSIGYDICGIWVHTPLELAKIRAADRKRKVDPEYIEAAYNELDVSRAILKSNVDIFKDISNNEPSKEDAKAKFPIKLYNRVIDFYKSPLKNPIGIKLRDELITNKNKYLSDAEGYSLDKLKKLANEWYTT